MTTIPLAQGALIFWDHFDTAIRIVFEKRKQEVTPELLEVLIHNQEHFRKVERYTFVSSMRFALTASCIRLKHRRELYASALSYYYNPRALFAAKRARAATHRGNPKPRPQARKERVRIALEKSGQYAFRLWPDPQ